MPFRSEKQRRFLWAKHPEIAKEWAHKYPDSNKGLPMYAHDKKDEDQPVSKEAALVALQSVIGNNLNSSVKSIFASACDKNTKKANSKLEQIKLPQDPKPTYAGERKLESILKPETEDEGNIGETRNVNHAENDVNTAENPLLSKLAIVLAPKIQQEIENRRAQEEARNANRMPQNVNIKKYPVQNFNVPPPMGMTAPQAPQAPQQQQQQAPAQSQNGQMAPVGGGQSPNANPINSFGGLSSTGDINGNAALGTQNMAGGEKMAAQKCSCGCGQKVNECTCQPSCSCRQKGGSCYGLKKQAGGNNPALAKIMGIAGEPIVDPAELDELEDDMFNKYAEKLATLGLWDRIRAKRKRGEKPAKPGDKDYPDSKNWDKVTAISEKQSGTPAWQRSEGKNDEGGLNEKGRKSYEREHGGNLKAPVTESNPSGERAKRQNSFCSRMCGMKRVNTGASTAKDPDSRINKSLRKWNCKCSSAMQFGVKMGHLLHWA